MHKTTLENESVGKTLKVVRVKYDSPPFLQHIAQSGLINNGKILITSHREFDGSLDVEIEGETRMVSQ